MLKKTFLAMPFFHTMENVVFFGKNVPGLVKGGAAINPRPGHCRV